VSIKFVYVIEEWLRRGKEVFYAVRGNLKEAGKFGNGSETRSMEQLIWDEVIECFASLTYLFVA
jgi:hypothetical protein